MRRDEVRKVAREAFDRLVRDVEAGKGSTQMREITFPLSRLARSFAMGHISLAFVGSKV